MKHNFFWGNKNVISLHNERLMIFAVTRMEKELFESAHSTPKAQKCY